MNRPVEVVGSVWVLHNSASGRNTGILVDDKSAVIIDPTGDQIDLATIDKGLDEQGRVVEAVVHTHRLSSNDIEWWSGVPRISAEAFEARSSLAVSAGQPHRVAPTDLLGGWEVVPLSKQAPTRMALYNVWERVLFCGEMLADTAANEAIPLLEGGSRWYIDALEVVKELDVKLLVPALGSIATGKRSIRKRIEADHNYLYDVRRLVITSIMGEVSLERVLAVTADLHEDFPFLVEHLANIRAVWAELSLQS